MKDLTLFLNTNLNSEQILKVRALEGKILKPDNTDVSRNFEGIVDLANLQYGYIKYSSPPDFIPINDASDSYQKPGQDYVQCIKFRVRLSDTLGGEIYTISNSSMHFMKSIASLNNAWLRSKKTNLLPRVKIEEWKKSNSPYGVINKPIFEITGLVERPAFEATPPSIRKSNDISRFFTSDSIDEAA